MPIPAVDVLIAIPAHDEERTLPRCLGHVLAAIEHARAEGAAAAATVAVAAHRCSDRTEQLARAILAAAPVRAVVLTDPDSPTIADVRRAAVGAALTGVTDPARTWLFNTDADSWVPPDWIPGLLAACRRAGAVGAAGMVEVEGWQASERAREAYAAIIAAGVHGSNHDHVYGANLAVRLDAYLAVGGFTAHRHGEDHDLVARLRATGHRVATPVVPRVITSGRLDPRCDQGLGALLRSLAARDRDCPAADARP